jgi:hypothetical protein
LSSYFFTGSAFLSASSFLTKGLAAGLASSSLADDLFFLSFLAGPSAFSSFSSEGLAAFFSSALSFAGSAFLAAATLALILSSTAFLA